MKTWILIMIVGGYGGEAITTNDIEFSNEEACKYAKSVVTKMKADRYTKVVASCVPKS